MRTYHNGNDNGTPLNPKDFLIFVGKPATAKKKKTPKNLSLCK